MRSVSFNEWRVGMRSHVPRVRQFYTKIKEVKVEFTSPDGMYFMVPYLVEAECRGYAEYKIAWEREHGYQLIHRCYSLWENADYRFCMAECYEYFMFSRDNNCIVERDQDNSCGPTKRVVAGDFSYEDLERRSQVFSDYFGLATVPCYVDGQVYQLPFMVRDYCGSFDDYWDCWMDQIGPSCDLKGNRVGSTKLLEKILKVAYDEYMDVLLPGSIAGTQKRYVIYKL